MLTYYETIIFLNSNQFKKDKLGKERPDISKATVENKIFAFNADALMDLLDGLIAQIKGSHPVILIPKGEKGYYYARCTRYYEIISFSLVITDPANQSLVEYTHLSEIESLRSVLPGTSSLTEAIATLGQKCRAR